jgi:hypothetical protein
VRLSQFEAAGISFDLGRHLPRILRASGLIENGHEGRLFVMDGGSPGALWFRLSMEQLRPRLVGPGKFSDVEVDWMLDLLANPDWAALSPVIFAGGAAPFEPGEISAMTGSTGCATLLRTRRIASR